MTDHASRGDAGQRAQRADARAGRGWRPGRAGRRCRAGLRGVRCVVIEPRTRVSHRRPRAKTTSIRTMEHLRRWGVADALRAAAPLPVAWSQRVTFCESLAGPRITDFDHAFGLTSRDERFAESGQQVPQPVVEEVLRDHVRSRPAVDLRLGHLALALAQDDGGVVVTVRDAGGAAYEIGARYLLGCDGASGIVRDQIGARYVGYSDPRPNFNVVFRAPSLDTHLGPAVQYWVLGGAGPGPGRQAGPGRDVVGHLPRHRRGVRGGTRVRADQRFGRRPRRPRCARLRSVDGPDADRGSVRRPARIPGRRERSRQPALGRSRIQHLRRGRRQHRVEDRGRRAGLGRIRPSRQLRARAARRDRADCRQRRVEHDQPGRRPAARGAGDPARQARRVLQPRAGPWVHVRRIASHPARRAHGPAPR